MVNPLSPQELNNLLKSEEDFVLIDTLSNGYFRKQHIPGAINIPLDKIEELTPLVADKNQKIVVYCFDLECQASPKAANKLEEMGFSNIFDMEEGIEGYKKAGFPIASFS